MKNKKDFIPFLESSHQFLSKNSPSRRSNSIIKGKMARGGAKVEKIYWDEMNEATPEVKIIENQGTIEAIQFRCSCGCNALIKLEYEKEPSKEQLN